jgi:hypothetical protein
MTSIAKSLRARAAYLNLSLLAAALWVAGPAPGAAGMVPEMPGMEQAVVAADAAAEGAEGEAATRAQNPLILGKTLGEWQARWYQWRQRLAVRTGIDPVIEEGDVDCSRGQSGPVWFLAGSPGKTLVRTNCVLPADKYVGLPLLNAAWFNDKSLGEDLTVHEKRLLLASVIDQSCGHLIATVDANSVALRYTIGRNQSPPFRSLYDPAKDDKPAVDPATIIDGYLAVIPPLAKGRHDIKLRGASCHPVFSFVSEVTYEDVLVE